MELLKVIPIVLKAIALVASLQELIIKDGDAFEFLETVSVRLP
jgi:hypothetical protein